MNPLGEVENVECPVCGPSPTRTWLNDGKLTCYVRCLSCGTVYASPRAPLATRYAWLDQTFGVGSNAFANATVRHAALSIESAILRRRLPDGGALLDIGCDLGSLFGWFDGPAWQRFGVELAPSAAAYASQVHAATVFAGTLRQANYPSASFDLITMMDMLYYLDDPQRDLQEVARILKPGGTLAIEISGQAYQLLRSRGPLCWLVEGRWTRLHTDSSYLFWPNPAGMQLLLQRCGLQTVEWHVIPSPEQSNHILGLLSRAHFGALSLMAKVFPLALTYAPKFLLVATNATRHATS